MVGQALLVAALVLIAYAIGYWVGRTDGRVDAMRWWRRVGRMGDMMQEATLDELGNPRMN